MKTYLSAAVTFLVSVAAPAFAADGKWHCTTDRAPGEVHEIIVTNGRVLQVFPDGSKNIPEQVIDLGREVHWVYGRGELAGNQEFTLDIDAATLVRVVFGHELIYSCTTGG